MNIEQLRYEIESSFQVCNQCEERIDGWPDADGSEPGRKVLFQPKLKAFAGVCPNGHFNEWTLKRAKAGELAPEDVTVRTCGRFVSQENCTHGKKTHANIPDGQTIVAAGGPIEGPAKIWMCLWCGRRERFVEGEKRLIL